MIARDSSAFPSTLLRLVLLLAIPVLSGSSLQARVFDETWAPKIFPGITNSGVAYPVGPGIPVAITVSTDRTRINPALFGNNAAIWDGDGALLNNTMKKRIRYAGINLFRWPGGSSSDTYHWDGVYPAYALSQGWSSMSQPWAVDSYEFLVFCEQLGIPNVIITANNGYSVYNSAAKNGSRTNAARLAADWVEYCNSPSDGSNPNGGTDWAAARASRGHPAAFGVRYWEVGNEVFGTWESGYDPVGTNYGRNFVAIVDRMKAVDPTIRIGLVVNVEDAGGLDWSRTVLRVPGVSSRVDFLVQHDYFLWVGAPWDKTASQVLASVSEIRADADALEDLIADETGRTDVSYTLDEWNTCMPANHHTMELTAGLFTAKALGVMAEKAVPSACLWDVQNGYSSSDGGDHAFTSKGHPGLPDYTSYPNYYPFYFFTRNFGDTLLKATSDDPAVSVFVSTFSGRDAGLVLINESGSDRTVTVSVPWLSGTADANAWVLTGNTLASKDISVNGLKSGFAAGGPDLALVVPYRMTIPDSRNFTVHLAKYSVTSLLMGVTPLRVVTGFNAENAGTRFDPHALLSWSSLTNPGPNLEYRILRGTAPGVYTRTNSAVTTSWLDTDLEQFTDYYYCVAAFTNGGAFAVSDQKFLEGGEPTGEVEVRGNLVRVPEGGNRTEFRVEIQADETRLKIDIYSSMGELVRKLVDDRLNRGLHIVQWNLDNDAGSAVASGTYIAVVRTGKQVSRRKVIVVR